MKRDSVVRAMSPLAEYLMYIFVLVKKSIWYNSKKLAILTTCNKTKQIAFLKFIKNLIEVQQQKILLNNVIRKGNFMINYVDYDLQVCEQYMNQVITLEPGSLKYISIFFKNNYDAANFRATLN